jgi:WD40 repeat protein
LTHDGYQQVGGAVGALAKRAEEIFSELDDAKREAAQRLFMRLVSLDEETKFTRRRATRSELLGIIPDVTALDEVIDSFSSQRLLSLDHDPGTRMPTVELAHEAILDEWARLRDWLDEARDDIRMQHKLAVAAEEWQEANKDEGFHLRGTRLDQFEEWAERTQLAITLDERDYLKASLAARDARRAEELARKEHEERLERRSRNFLRGLVGVFALASVVSLVMFNVSRNAQRTAESEAEARATQQSIAEAESIRAAEEADARATQQSIAEEETRDSFARELAASALNVLDLDPQLSVLLALQAVETTYKQDGSVLQEAGNALHHAAQGTTNRLILSFPSSDPYLWKVAFGPDATRLATYGTPTIIEIDPRIIIHSNLIRNPLQMGGQTRVWDWQTGELLFTLPGQLAAGNWLDEVHIATVHDLNKKSFKFTIWNTHTGEALSTIEYVPSFFTTDDVALQDYEFTDIDIDSVKLSSDWRYLSISFSPSNNFLHIVWDITTGQEVYHHERTGIVASELAAVTFSSPSEFMVTGTYRGTLNKWNIGNGELIYSNSEQANIAFILDIAHHPNENLYATAYYHHVGATYSGGRKYGSNVVVWDSDTGQAKVSLIPITESIWSVTFNEDGTLIATGSQSGIVTIWSAITGQRILSLSHSNQEITDVAFSPDNKFIATTSVDGIITIWDIRPDYGYELYSLGQDSVATTVDPFSISLSPDGRNLFAIDSHGGCHVWDAATGELKDYLESQKQSFAQLTHSPSGDYLGAISQDGVFMLWDSHTGEEELSISGFYGCCFAFHPFEDLVAITTTDHSVAVINIEDLLVNGSIDLAEQAHFTQIFEPILDITYNAKGNALAVLGQNSYLKVFHLEIGESQTIQILNASSIASQHKGSLLAIAHIDGSIGLINADTRELILNLPGHPTFINEVLFTNDDNNLISASRDGTVKIWDVATGEVLQTIFVHSLGVTDITLSPDGKRLYAAAADGTIRAYLLDIEELIALAYNRLTRWFTPEECQTYLHTDTCPPPP